MLKMLVPRTKNQEQGFTLLEIIITMSLVGILAAIGMPSLLGMLDKSSLDQSLDKLQGAIQNAQRQALRKSQSCGIYIFQESGVYKLAGLNSDDRTSTSPTWEKSRGCVVQGEAVTLTLRSSTANILGFTMASGVEVKTNEKRSFIEFTSKGFPNFSSTNYTQNGALIVLRAEGVNEQRCVFVSPSTGLVRTGKYLGDFSQTPIISQCKINSIY